MNWVLQSGVCGKKKDLSGAGGMGIDPEMLTVFEKRRIRNPLIVTLEALAKGFKVTMSDHFRQAKFNRRNFFALGSQKGLRKIDLPSQGIQRISFTPLMEDLFCGKMMLEGQKRFDETLFSGGGAFFMMILIGQSEGEIEGRKVNFKEGGNLYLWGGMKFRHVFW